MVAMCSITAGMEAFFSRMEAITGYRLAQLTCTLGCIYMRKHDVEHHDVEALGFLVILIHFDQMSYLLKLRYFQSPIGRSISPYSCKAL